MARVFHGQVAIPGDQMEAYLEALGQFEKDKAPLRAQLEHCAHAFADASPAVYAQNDPQACPDPGAFY
jgi:hypothetical protein